MKTGKTGCYASFFCSTSGKIDALSKAFFNVASGTVFFAGVKMFHL
jgi:hypothetical protein